MDILRFRTNINCGSCIHAVTPGLNAESRIRHWEVDVTDPSRILTVHAEGLSPEDVVRIVARAGFDAGPLAAGEGAVAR